MSMRRRANKVYNVAFSTGNAYEIVAPDSKTAVTIAVRNIFGSGVRIYKSNLMSRKKLTYNVNSCVAVARYADNMSRIHSTEYIISR